MARRVESAIPANYGKKASMNSEWMIQSSGGQVFAGELSTL